MERQVLFRDRQEFQAADSNNAQVFTDEAIQHVIMDAITTERMFVGLVVSQKSSTEYEVDMGRLWCGDEGKVYRQDAAKTYSVVEHLPTSDLKYLTVSVMGQEVETDIQPRDYLIDLQTGQTEPRDVAMESVREVVTHTTPGLESAGPQKPEAPTGYTVIGHVLLSNSGIVEINRATNRQLMQLFGVYQTQLVHKAWIAAMTPKINTLQSDIAGLAAKLKGFLSRSDVVEITADVARIKEELALPETFSSYSADDFYTNDESDYEDAEYNARTDKGLRFPWDGQTEQALALFNPVDEAVKVFNGFILPAHSEIVRLETSGYAGSLGISQYTYQTNTFLKGTRSRIRIRYGPTRRISMTYKQWKNEGVATIYQLEGESFTITHMAFPPGFEEFWDEALITVYYQTYWFEEYEEPYWYVDTTEHAINGSQIAQTVLSAQNGWLLKVGLFFPTVAADGVVNLHICETENGLPNPGKCIGSTSVDAENINTYPAETIFTFQEPVFLAAGKRYALMLTTGGNHHIALVEGTQYTHGTLFYNVDGSYFQGDFEKDWMLKLYFAEFDNPRTVVELATISLSGGIVDLDLIAEAIIPDPTELTIEYQKDGKWYAIQPDTAEILGGTSPAMLPMRAVFNGTKDIMPGLGLTVSRLQANRPATTFKHISAERTLTANSEDIDVIVQLEAWDAVKHTCTVSLINGASSYSAASTSDVTLDEETIRRTVNFTPEVGTGIGAYQIVIEGTSSTALDIFHISERIDIAK